MNLQSRDERLFLLLSRYGVLSTRQIRSIAFDRISQTTVLRRLRLLEKNEFIVRVLGLEGGLCAWALCRAGARKIGAELPFRYTNRNATEHEVVLSEFRIGLERLGFAKDWTSGMEIKRQGYRDSRRSTTEQFIPDGLFTAYRQGKPQVIAVELELHAKANARYQKLFKQYATKSTLGLIWYVVPKRGIGETVLREWWHTLDSRYSPAAPPCLGYSILEELPTGPDGAEIYLGQGKLTSFFRMFTPSATTAKETEAASNSETGHDSPGPLVAQPPTQTLGNGNPGEI